MERTHVNAIETRNLVKTFGHRAAVNDLTMHVPRGKIVGFVGPNGAGKTTTIRMLLGLVRPTAGTADVLGQPISDPGRYLGSVGALIETPAFYPGLSGAVNLDVLCSLGGISTSRIPPLIETVGLKGRERDTVGSYSLGMKQRLGIAAALLPDPELLVLDEPSNGLDPTGIIEMRALLRRLCDQGKTIFVSSHLLGELERIADWLVIVKGGRALYCGPASEFRAEGDEALILSTESPDQMDALVTLVKRLGYPAVAENGELRVVAPATATAEISREAASAGVTLTEIKRQRQSLEDRFLQMINGGQRA